MSRSIPDLSSLTLGAAEKGKLALRADWVLLHDGNGHRLCRDGEVLIENGRVLHAGKPTGAEARVVNFGPALISPGFVDLDALSDLDTTILGVDHNPGWAKGRVWPRDYAERAREMYSPEDLAFQKRYAFGQLLMSGITSAAPIASLFYREWGETVAEFDAAADAAGEMGLRVFLSPAYRAGGMVLDEPGKPVPYFDEDRGFEGLDAAIEYIERQHGRHGGLVNGMLAPDRVETCTAELLRRTDAAARDLGCKIRLHMAQGVMERETVQALHGMTGPAWLESLGVLSDRLICPHATDASDADLQLYADRGVSVAHCPLVSSRSGSYLNSFKKLRRMGIRIGMGTDTVPADMVMNLLSALVTARIAEPGPEPMSAPIWEAATSQGADALGRPDLGRIAKGLPADIAVFDLADPLMTPAIDPVETVILGGTGRTCRATFVDGRLSMRRADGLRAEVAGLPDLEAAQARAQTQFDAMKAQYPDRSWNHPPLSEIFPPSFPLEERTDEPD
ncbi:chlorohydrolase family protein [Thalassorhabdomicrobium marinisediminis]|uniref:chlorohydrolase family protein n=1 Tax=Thalassorhabdomicrobium marinisediminis TaxID=2170577 RepID=UPI0024926C16|nr:chlorohydrolase family protein [Thalassorhabdomicrobium marinisediminis]